MMLQKHFSSLSIGNCVGTLNELPGVKLTMGSWFCMVANLTLGSWFVVAYLTSPLGAAGFASSQSYDEMRYYFVVSFIGRDYIDV